ncbi:MAG TPA: hypothetical protein VJX73_17315 [Terracidiphilus sp.]|nr:hypothetical protein [Terracidiphilus sp.]
MLAPGEVIDKARTYLGEVVPEFAALKPKIEEMALDSRSSEWKIIFFAYRGDNPNVATVADLLRRQRIEKVVYVGADDGSLIAVKNPPAAVPF